MALKAPVRIDGATCDDVSTLLPLVQAYWEADGIPGFDAPRIRAALEGFLDEPRLGCGWIARTEDGMAVGYLLAVLVFSLEHGGLTAEIDEFFVAAGHRSAGLGSMLLDTAESALADMGCTNLSLQLSRNNGQARDFYRRHGFAHRSGYDLLDKSLRGEA